MYHSGRIRDIGRGTQRLEKVEFEQYSNDYSLVCKYVCTESEKIFILSGNSKVFTISLIGANMIGTY